VKNEGESLLTVKAGELTDSGMIRRVDKENPDYILREAGAVLNWFDVTEQEGRFSLNDKISDIIKTEDGRRWVDGFLQRIKNKAEQGGNGSGGFEAALGDGGAMMDMMGGFTVLRLSSMLGMMGASFTKEELLDINRELNSVKRE
jgi:beta-galactosidase